jgi:hypothetical protein
MSNDRPGDNNPSMIAKQKLATLVNTYIAPQIASFVKSLTDVELVELLKSFKTMNIDLIKDLTNEAKERKIMSDSWEDESPFDKLIEGGIADK